LITLPDIQSFQNLKDSKASEWYWHDDLIQTFP